MSLKNGNSTIPERFMASRRKYGEASIVMVGAPMDFTCSFKPGARFGPGKIREVSYGLEEYSMYSGRSLDDVSFYDCGDLDLALGNVEKSMSMIGRSAGEILKDGKFPIFIGGEHLISVPVIKQAYEKYGNELAVIQMDAHADLREGYAGSKYSHASAMKRVLDFLPEGNLYQLGVRSATRDEFEYASQSTHFHPFEVLVPMERIVAELRNRPVYVTLDIDVVDPAYANGTGTPEPGGITSAELLKTAALLKELNLTGFDLVEVSPVYDISDRTALLAAKVIREVLAGITG